MPEKMHSKKIAYTWIKLGRYPWLDLRKNRGMYGSFDNFTASVKPHPVFWEKMETVHGQHLGKGDGMLVKFTVCPWWSAVMEISISSSSYLSSSNKKIKRMRKNAMFRFANYNQNSPICIWGFPTKWWVSPTNPWVFLLQMIITWGGVLGGTTI